jgi:hypothetical protein
VFSNWDFTAIYSTIITFHGGHNTETLNKIHGGKRQSLNVTLQTYYSETCLKQNLGIIETSLKRGTPTVPRIQASGTSMKWYLPAT